MACEELKKEANKNIIEEKARIIYEDYVSILSPKEVCTHRKVFAQEAISKMNTLGLFTWHSSGYSQNIGNDSTTIHNIEIPLTMVPPVGSECP